MWASVLDIIASALPTVLGWFGLGKTPDGPSADYKAGEAAGRLQEANDNKDRTLDHVEIAHAIDRAADEQQLRDNGADPRASDGFRRD